ncbi:MAG: DUF4114 domain-containing protein [Sulfuricurvum sp.]|nr:DUF4114 domain-containing protein [Sulfuricurvum sp.]
MSAPSGTIAYQINGLGVAGGTGNADYINADTNEPEVLVVDFEHAITDLTLGMYSGTNQQSGSGSNGEVYWVAYDSNGHYVGEGLTNVSSKDFSVAVNPEGTFQYLAIFSHGADNDGVKFSLKSATGISYAEGNDTFTYLMQDADGDTATGQIDVTATSSVDTTAPVIANQSFTYAEGQTAGATVANVAASDNVGITSFTFTATGTNTSADGFYQIDNSGVITLTTAGAASAVNDFEQGINSGNYAINAKDSVGNMTTATITLNETNIDESPTIVSSYTSLTSSQEKVGSDYGDLMLRDFPTVHEGQTLSSAQQIDVGEIILQTTQDISVKFISEGAGFKSSFGWYTIAEDGTIGNMQIIWDNASATGSGGSLIPNASTVNLGSITEGTKIGFFLIADGYTDGVRAGQTLNVINSSTGNSATIYDQETPNLYANGTLVNNQSTADLGQIYFLSYSNLNRDDRVHAIGGRGSTDGMLKIGFEDLYGGGDQDFEDIVFEINLGTATMKSLASGWLGDVVISDPDSENLTSSSVAITTNYHTGDALKLDPMYSIDGNGNVLLNGIDTGINSSGFNSITGILNFTGTASLSVYSELLSSISFQTDSGINGTREIQFSGIDDQGNESNFNVIEYTITAPTGSTLNGSSGNDTMNGTEGDDTIYGNNGNDTLNGDNGNDILVGGSGSDKLFGGFGNDTLITDLVATRIDGDNTLTGDNIVNSIDGGAGTDTLIFTGDTNINFKALSSNNNPIANIEIIDLSQGNHQLTNLSLSDVIDMTDSNHTLTIVGDSADSVNIPQTSGNYSVAKAIDGGFDVYTYSSNAGDPTVTVKIEQDITHS